jgi:dihydropteroate synthase
VISPRGSFLLPLPHRPALELGDRTLVMGVLNVTPDSFSDGGSTYDPARAVERAQEIEAAGADILDLGAESTRPGAEPIGADEEWRRLQPVLNRLASTLRIPISIDTYRAGTADRALRAGAVIVNDISALRYDPGLGSVVAAHRAALVLMHTRGRSRDMYVEAHYGEVVHEIASELQESIDHAVRLGVEANRIIVDPGFGFAKKAEHSMIALARLAEFSRLGRPILSGPSRKSFLTSATGALPAAERDWATAAAVTASVFAGAHIIRVHRVAEMLQVVRVADAIRRAAQTGGR